jgi:hypothetical protein
MLKIAEFFCSIRNKRKSSQATKSIPRFRHGGFRSCSPTAAAPPLQQIQLSLGHDSILTTERYLGIR